jgi:protein-S-isoprenylcysteine O-methyltransferase Ste14
LTNITNSVTAPSQTSLSSTKESRFALLQVGFLRWGALLGCWLVGCLVWQYNPFFQKELSLAETKDLLWNASFLWMVLGPLWEFGQAKILKEKYLNASSQAVLAWSAVFKCFKNLSDPEQQAILFLALRFFYLPIMVQFCITHVLGFNLPANLKTWSEWQAYLTDFGWLQNSLYLLDTIPFAVAYFINVGPFRTRSVDSSFWGWFFCLSCYPPFNGAWGEVFPYTHEEFLGWWGWISFGLIIVYVWASLALGLRAGHLQYRGLCNKGPYALVRHPAYVSKTGAWIVGAVAWCFMQANSGLGTQELVLSIFWNLIGCAFWTWVYYQRALTEEKHLCKYPEYLDYCAKVKYRYIPGWF